MDRGSRLGHEPNGNQGRKKQGSISCRTDRAKEANNMFIIWICWLFQFWKCDREREVRTATYGPGIDQSQHAKSASHIIKYSTGQNITVIYNTIQCSKMKFYALLYYTILYYTILYYTILYYTILYYTILYYTILYYTILYYTILYYTILYYTILYYTILYYTILYYTLSHALKNTANQWPGLPLHILRYATGNMQRVVFHSTSPSFLARNSLLGSIWGLLKSELRNLSTPANYYEHFQSHPEIVSKDFRTLTKISEDFPKILKS